MILSGVLSGQDFGLFPLPHLIAFWGSYCTHVGCLMSHSSPKLWSLLSQLFTLHSSELMIPSSHLSYAASPCWPFDVSTQLLSFPFQITGFFH